VVYWLGQKAYVQEVVGSNPTVYWMDESEASYYIENKKNKGNQMGQHQKKNIEKSLPKTLRFWFQVYSFGVAGDWSFEEAAALTGCQVRAFDPTTDESSKPEMDLITFSKTGLSHKAG